MQCMFVNTQNCYSISVCFIATVSITPVEVRIAPKKRSHPVASIGLKKVSLFFIIIYLFSFPYTIVGPNI